MIPLPDSLDPTLKLIINGLVYVHLAVFLVYFIMLARSFGRKDEKDLKKFKEQHAKHE